MAASGYCQRNMVRQQRSDPGDRNSKTADGERTSVAPESERVPRSAPESERVPRSTRRKVMVIDDSEIVLEATRGMLRSAGFDVVTCASPIGATLQVFNEKPDVVLVDLDMASMGGDKLIMLLKQGPRTSHIPVYLYTGQHARIAEEAVRRSKADGFIPKGCDPLLLAYAVRRALSK